MKFLQKIIPVLLIASMFYACDEEEYVYPDVLTEILNLETDAQGYGHRLITDEGKTWSIPQSQRPDELTSDSLYRVLCKYVPCENGEATVYTLQSVNAPLPKVESEFKTIHTDAVSIQSIWRSGEYLNLILQVMVKDQKHEFAFVDQGITTNEDGTKTLSLMLYHNRNNDVEGFYRKAYLSIPLWHYQSLLNPGDLIVFRLNTYEEGMTTRAFNY